MGKTAEIRHDIEIEQSTLCRDKNSQNGSRKIIVNLLKDPDNYGKRKL